MIEQELIEILYNSCYGGWGISDKALELYKLRNDDLENLCISNVFCDELLDRTDPILIQIFNELGDKINTKCSKIKIKKIPKIYKNYYSISEYDGKERIDIDFTNNKIIVMTKTSLKNKNNNNNNNINKKYNNNINNPLN